MLCGNGRVDPGPAIAPEECDEGAMNGGFDAHCTKQCLRPPGPPNAGLGSLDLGPPISDIVRLTVATGQFSVATLSHEDQQVRVWKGDDSVPLRVLRVSDPVVSLASIPVLGGPAWIERAPGAPPHLYVADYVASDPPTIRELPYPFPEGLRPELVGHAAWQGLA